MILTASKLRENLYRILDQVAETGVPVEVARGHRRLKIVAVERSAVRKIKRLKPRPWVLRGAPQSLVHMDWSKEWK